MIKERVTSQDSQHYVNYLQEKISVTDIWLFFSLPSPGRPKVLPNTVTLLLFTVIKLHNHIQTRKFHLKK